MREAEGGATHTVSIRLLWLPDVDLAQEQRVIPGLSLADMVALVKRALAIDLVVCGSSSLWRGELSRPADVVIIVTSAGIEFRYCLVEWRTPHDPVSTSRPFLLLAPADLPASPAAAEELLRHLAEATRIVGRGHYQTCRHCHQMIPPGRMHDPETCQECAAARGGAIF